MVVLYGVGFQFAWGTIPWIYPAELFSMSEKGLLDDSGDLGLAGDVFMLEGEDSAQNWGICIGIPSPIFQTLRIAHPNHFNQPPKKNLQGRTHDPRIRSLTGRGGELCGQCAGCVRDAELHELVNGRDLATGFSMLSDDVFFLGWCPEIGGIL